MSELIRILEREAIVLEHVLFRLTAVELLLTADEHRFLTTAADELHEALDRLGVLEEARERAVRGLGPVPAEDEDGTPALSALLRLADERQRGQLLRQQLQLRALLTELEEHAHLCRDFALARVARVRTALERLGGTPGSRYGRDGLVSGMRPPPSFDERL